MAIPLSRQQPSGPTVVARQHHAPGAFRRARGGRCAGMARDRSGPRCVCRRSGTARDGSGPRRISGVPAWFPGHSLRSLTRSRMTGAVAANCRRQLRALPPCIACDHCLRASSESPALSHGSASLDRRTSASPRTSTPRTLRHHQRSRLAEPPLAAVILDLGGSGATGECRGSMPEHRRKWPRGSTAICDGPAVNRKPAATASAVASLNPGPTPRSAW